MSSTGSFQYWQRSMVHSGPGTVVRIPGLFANMGAKRVLLISDAGIASAGLLDRVADLFSESPAKGGPQIVATYAAVAPDAEAASVDEALAIARQYAVDSILAVGGGSVQDAAKLIKIALHRKCMSVMELLRPLVRFIDWPQAQPTQIPHVSVPTTAGTGAELTQAAVIYNQALGVKHLLACHYMEADIAVLDAHLTLGLPPGLTASTGMDALTHALETLAHTHVNSFAQAHAVQATKLIVENLPVAVCEGGNVMARQRLLEASALACNAFQTDLGAAPVHNFAHAVGALCHIHHGEANGVLLPAVLEEMPDFYLPTVDRLADALGVVEAAAEETPETKLENCATAIRSLLEQIGHPQTFSHHGVESSALSDVVSAVAQDPIAAFCRIREDTIAAVCRVAFGWA